MRSLAQPISFGDEEESMTSITILSFKRAISLSDQIGPTVQKYLHM